MSFESTTVPAGHEVHLFGRSNEPFVGRTPGGLLLASTGFGGDDQVAEISSLLDALAAQMKPWPVVMNSAIVRLGDLFVPSAATTRAIESAATLYFQAGSVAGWTVDGLEGVVTRLRDLGRRTELVVGLDPTRDLRDLEQLLTRAGIAIRVTGTDGTLVAEVRRPDGSHVTGLVASASTIPEAPVAQTSLMRSPRFDALLLDIVRDDIDASRRALEAYLKQRTAPLSLIATRNADGGFGVRPRSWSDTEAFVAYGDQRSLHRAAAELGHSAGSYAIVAMPIAALCTWASSVNMRVMLCVFDDRADGTHKAWHVGIEDAVVRRLAS